MLSKRAKPDPPLAQGYESRVTLIRPYRGSEIAILATCHLIRNEARAMLQRKTDHCRYQPVRYLVDYSATWALINPNSVLRSCLARPDAGINMRENEAVKAFLRTCKEAVSRTRRGKKDGGGVRAIEMTINHKSEVAYGYEVLRTALWLKQMRYFGPTRVVVVYQSPLPWTRLSEDDQARDSAPIEECTLKNIPREPGAGEQAGSSRGFFVRPLDVEAFTKHVEGLVYC